MKIIIFVYVFLLFICSTAFGSNYDNTPYSYYCFDNINEKKNISLEYYCNKIKKLDGTERDFLVHKEILRFAYSQKHFGLAMFAANEAYKLRPADPGVNYALGILFGLFGQKKLSLARLWFCSISEANIFIKRKADRAIIELEENGCITYEKQSF